MQFTLVRHAEEAGWTVVSDMEALSKRRGETGLFFYAELEDALLRLNPGVVTPENVNNIVQRIESVPKTIEGNKEIQKKKGERSTTKSRHREVDQLSN